MSIGALNVWASLMKETPMESIREIGVGTSNKIFQVNEKYAFRVKLSSDPFFYKAENEKACIDAFGELTPKLAHIDAMGNKAEAFIDGHKLESPEDCKKIGEALAKLHKKSPEGVPPMDHFARYEFYKARAGIKDTDPFEEAILAKAKEILGRDINHVIHADLVKDNILIDEEKATFIDLEFAGSGSIYFDIASFLSENSIDDVDMRNAFVQGYFGRNLNNKERKDIHLVMAYEDYLWMYWALYRYIETGNQMFENIALDKERSINKENITLSKWLD